MKKSKVLVFLLLVLALSAVCVFASCTDTQGTDTQSEATDSSTDTNGGDGVTDLGDLSSVVLEDGALYRISTLNEQDFESGSLTSVDFATEDNAMVKVDLYGRHLSQMWRAHKNDDGTYSFENMASRMYLSIRSLDNYKKEKKLSVCLEGTNDEAKKWNVYTLDGTIENCVFENTYTSRIATVASTNTSGLYYVQQEEYEDTDAQRWKFTKLSDGDGEYPYVLALTGDYTGASSCPEILYYNGVYYNYNMTGTIAVKTSTDLINWTRLDKYALEPRPSWLTSVSAAGSIWAPGAYKIGDKYFLYYCTSSSGSQNSGIGVAITDDPSKNNWVDQGLVIRSYHNVSNFNAIDPNIFIDDDGTVFLVYGSYWDGIFMRKINPETGKLDESDTTAYHIAKGNHDMEAPYLIKHGDYYYLFTARGGLSKGTYYWAVGRSKSVYGPYVDKDGKELLSGNGGTRLTEWKEGIAGVAHAQYFEDKDGNAYMVSESWPYRGSDGNGTIQLHISTIVWTEDGWPVTALDKNVLNALGE